MQLKKGTLLEVEFTSLTAFGQAHAKVTIEDHEYNLVCPDLYPGDFAQVELTKIKKNFLEASLVELKKASDWRVTTRNNYFGISNATPLEALNYEKQLELKTNEVHRILGNLDLVEGTQIMPIVGMQDPWYYRNKVEYSFGYTKDFDPVIGFHVKNRRFDIVDATSCHLFSENASELLSVAKQVFFQYHKPYQFSCNQGDLRTLTFKQTQDHKQLMVILEVSNFATLNIIQSDLEEFIKHIQPHYEQAISAYYQVTTVLKGRRTTKELVHVSGPECISETLKINQKDYFFQIFPDSFFQPNPSQASKIFELVQNITAAHSAQVVYDLFCGTGTLGIIAANAQTQVYGIDIVESSIQLAINNSKLNNLENTSYVADDIYKNLNQYSWPDPDLIIVDPPRKGLGEKTIDLIVSKQPPVLVYVSCNLKTFAQDAAFLKQSGYRLKQVTPVDQFPHTKHLEVVSEFIRDPK